MHLFKKILRLVIKYFWILLMWTFFSMDFFPARGEMVMMVVRLEIVTVPLAMYHELINGIFSDLMLHSSKHAVAPHTHHALKLKTISPYHIFFIKSSQTFLFIWKRFLDQFVCFWFLEGWKIKMLFFFKILVCFHDSNRVLDSKKVFYSNSVGFHFLTILPMFYTFLQVFEFPPEN